MLDQFLSSAARLLVPGRCIGCDNALSSGGQTEPLCHECSCTFVRLPEERCDRCALPSPCGFCDGELNCCDLAVSVSPYGGVARRVVLRVKSRGSSEAVSWIATQLAREVAVKIDVDSLVAVPVPPHRSRLHRRGFDHAELIARSVALELGMQSRRCLRRSNTRDPQSVGFGRLERLERASSFDVSGRRTPEKVLLVDDVYTTGATLGAAATALREGGSKLIVAATFARTLR